MARYYLGDHDSTTVAGAPAGVGRQTDDQAAVDTPVVLARNVEGGKVGDTVTVSADRANWLIRNGQASLPGDFVDQYAGSRRPANPDPAPEPEPEEPVG